MQHYVCTGDCGGESPRPGMCESVSCSREGKPLSECDCDDGFHKGVVGVTEEVAPDVEKMDDEDQL